MSKKPNPYAPENFRISGDTNVVGAEKVLVRIDVRKPNKQEFFRVYDNEDYQLQCAILELKEEREIYLVAPNVTDALIEDIRPVRLHLCINRQETLYFWPVPLPGTDGRTNHWHESARTACEMAKNEWIRMIANMSEGGYSIYRATGDIPEPKWPDKAMADLLELAFGKGKLIESYDHPVIQKLKGA